MDSPTRNALYETIADNIERMILSKDLHADSRLPSEQYLADSFNVSRPVIREALKLLRERGLIASRQGAATVITEPCADTLIKNMSRIVLMKNVRPMQVYQIRMVLETLSVRQAAECFTQKDIDDLYEINRKVKDSAHTLPLRAENDLLFHKRIAEISGNPLLTMMLDAISTLMLPLIISNLEKLGESENGCKSHELIIEAIASGNAARAAETMKAHLSSSAQYYGNFAEDIFALPTE